MATMDFFESQEVARKQTGRLIFLFVLAVLGIVVMNYVVIATMLGYVEQQTEFKITGAHLLNWKLFTIILAGTIVIIAGGSTFKVAQLAAGGNVIAELLRGRLVHTDTNDRAERRLLNVVEEMAIASGSPVPLVYLLDHEQGINAFAAGFTAGDAVIGVTRGCVERLSRDQLQGVVAHEFSHILNGDMRINIRLIGILHGILIIGFLGYYILRASFYSGRSRRGGSRKGWPIHLIGLGLGLMVVGFVGSFFGSMIRAAVSRQREHLADASAVQFTRNPSGLAGALKVIGGYSAGSQIENPHAPEASHMFFGQGVSVGLTSLFATHPPLDVRIRKIEPHWQGEFPATDQMKSPFLQSSNQPTVASLAELTEPATSKPKAALAGQSSVLEKAVQQIGRPTNAHLDYVRRLIKTVPREILDAVHEPYSARVVVYALLMNKDLMVRQAQIDLLSKTTESVIANLVDQLLPQIQNLDDLLRLPLVDMAVPALAEMSPAQYDDFLGAVDNLVRADRVMDLFEWSLQWVLIRHLKPHFCPTTPARVQYKRLSPTVLQHCEVLLSTLAHLGHKEKVEIKRAFSAGATNVATTNIRLLPKDDCKLAAMDSALQVLDRAAPKLKRQIIQACAACVSADRALTVKEVELLRAICDGLSSPMPPIIDLDRAG